MAFTDSRTYILYYQDVPLGSITHSHHGLGWKTGCWTSTPHFADYADFISAYAALVDAWEEDEQEVFSPAKLAEKYGPTLTNVEHWYLVSEEDRRESLLTIPLIDEILGSVSWKPAY